MVYLLEIKFGAIKYTQVFNTKELAINYGRELIEENKESNISVKYQGEFIIYDEESLEQKEIKVIN